MKSKIHKHKHDIKEDKFVTAAFIISEFVKTHWKKLLGIVTGIVIVIIIIVAINSHQKSIENRALRQFDLALSVYFNNDFNKAEEEFQILKDDFPSTKEGKYAYLYLGKIFLERDSVDYVQADEYFRKAVSVIKNDILKQAAMVGIAKCYLGQNNKEKYYSYLEKIVKKFPNFYKTSDLLFEIGEYYYEQDILENAEIYFRQIVERFENSQIFYKAKNRLDEIKQKNLRVG